MTASLEMIDLQQGLPLQVWPIPAGRRLQIGRSDEADVVIASPFVSRAHAYLHEPEGGEWELVSLSEKGIFVDGEKRTTLNLADGVVFRLANKGPLFRFRCNDENGVPVTSATISFDEDTMPLLVLDRKRLDEEVSAIADNGYFEDLQRVAEQIQQRKRERERRGK